MKLLITGGTGFIGKTLCEHLLDQGHHLILLTRNPEKIAARYTDRNVEVITSIETLAADKNIDAIINLAGEGIADQRWSEQRKRTLIASREKTTQAVVDYIKRAHKVSPHKPHVLISGSAVGYYGDQGDVEVDETCGCNDDFAHQICDIWESAACQAEALGVRVCIVRLGLVVGAEGGFLQRMLLPFRLRLGSSLGSGKQWMSWVHIADVVGAIDFLLHKKDAEGAYNVTAPHPVSNLTFTQEFARSLNRPAVFATPAFVLKLALGEMSELLLGGQKVMPSRLQASGYKFKYTKLQDALESVVNITA